MTCVQDKNDMPPVVSAKELFCACRNYFISMFLPNELLNTGFGLIIHLMKLIYL